jgi:hypothetical protein
MARGLLDCPVKPGNDKEELGRAQTKSGRANPATSVMIETASWRISWSAIHSVESDRTLNFLVLSPDLVPKSLQLFGIRL